jgi:hypothetical protein
LEIRSLSFEVAPDGKVANFKAHALLYALSFKLFAVLP